MRGRLNDKAAVNEQLQTLARAVTAKRSPAVGTETIIYEYPKYLPAGAPCRASPLADGGSPPRPRGHRVTTLNIKEKRNMKLGVIADCYRLPVREAVLKAAKDGFDGVQLYATEGEFSPENLTPSLVREYKALFADNGLCVSALCADVGGYGFERDKDNPARIEKTKRIIDLAAEFGAKAVTSHIGVIPADETVERYDVMRRALGEIGGYAHEAGVTVAIETGPERAVTLRRFVKNCGKGVGVNLDPANFTMVTGQDAVDAVYVLREFIVHTHLKDGIMLAPTDPTEVYHAFAVGGVAAFEACKTFKEVPLGEGQVDFRSYFAALKDVGYDGFLTIEREVGKDPAGDVIIARDAARKLLSEI